MNKLPSGYINWERTDRGIAFSCPLKDQMIEIEEKALSEEIKSAIKEGYSVWINDYNMDDEGNANFEFKVYLPN